jgi:hypothetical protein
MATLDQVDTIVIVMMENRSFDHMLGYLSHPDFGKRPDVDGQRNDPAWLARFTNAHGGIRQAPFHAKQLDMTDDPKHERESFKVQFGADFRPGAPYPMTGFMNNRRDARGDGVLDSTRNSYHEVSCRALWHLRQLVRADPHEYPAEPPDGRWAALPGSTGPLARLS